MKFSAPAEQLCIRTTLIKLWASSWKIAIFNQGSFYTDHYTDRNQCRKSRWVEFIFILQLNKAIITGFLLTLMTLIRSTRQNRFKSSPEQNIMDSLEIFTCSNGTHEISCESVCMYYKVRFYFRGKNMYTFFSFVLFYFSPNECSCWHRPGQQLGKT